MSKQTLRLVLGDQLSLANPVLVNADPERDCILLAEVAEEAGYVKHNRHKIVLIFSAMRHFAEALRERGFDVVYRSFDEGVASLFEAVEGALADSGAEALLVTAPGEYRLLVEMQSWGAKLDGSVVIQDDDRFLSSVEDFESWADGRKQFRMEYFYREMRRRYNLLLDSDGEPEGGKWNYDADNRSGWRSQVEVPERPSVAIDTITADVIELVEDYFPDNPGKLSDFRLAVTSVDAQAQFDWFCHYALENFGTYQDALAEESPWMFHGLISMYLNIGLLEPLAVCKQVESAWREGHCSLAGAEGFIRQVLGWREYVRGIYWHAMPGYAERNTFDASRPLPSWFWSGDTDMRCLSQALTQSLDLGYAHHIQRLMVIGNFALLTGLDVGEVCDWYLAVYVDAFEWVELPNTLGMALHGDKGLMASKPYAASGKYIQRQGNHCSACRYDPKQTTGENACPYNSLYWHFIDRHQDYLTKNSRMGLIVGGWKKRASDDRQAIVEWGDRILATILD
ncbi:cryptochrome/photolyase family protein [Congregibacter brevis]|uniref:Cryptochrome/photolyase family protein n=1 Tax=Congregibacter brevis TaxID=3081201 RepID=A0ABZ0IC24_9GAMM|nr:cryptochrome/photolyase family protein [Congregibacter sp. IMCC45268]